MSEATVTQPTELTYEGVVDRILSMLRRAGALSLNDVPTPWDSFLKLSDLIHERYEVPSTTLTPIMRRLLFALGFGARPRTVVGVGTYVGYTFSWLLRDHADNESAPFCETAIGIDVDAAANALARRNCAAIGHGPRLTFLDGDGVTLITKLKEPIDLLYLDLDDPVTGKAGYRQALEAASPFLRPRGLVLAHDACVSKFAPDFVAYHSYVRECGLFSGTWILPVDFCGLSVAAVR
jgi:predicted O-methyltransferase YrrM